MSKSITSGLLAFAVSSSLLVAQGEKPAGGWSAKAGSGITYDGGDQFGINMLNFVQARWGLESPDEGDNTMSFDVPRTRTLLRGHAFNKNINYVVQVDYQDSDTDSIVRDAYAHWNFADGVGVRFGQGKTQFGLENTGTIRGTMFTERSGASDEFNYDRTQGLWLMGTNVENKLRWSLGIVNGLGTEETPNNDDSPGIVASANFDVLGDYIGGGREWWQQGDLRDGDRALKGTIGVGIATDTTTATPATETDTTAFNVNTAWSIQGFQVMGEYFSENVDDGTADGDNTGYYLQGTYALGKSDDSAMRWALGLRYSSVDATENGGDETNDISLVVNALYHGHNCKTQLEFTSSDNKTADTTDTIVALAFQLVF
jgi:phosphate-selective porin